MEKLFTEFNGTTANQWKDQIIKDLKGIDFNSLISETSSHLTVKPFYTREDLKAEKQILFKDADWDICSYINVEDEQIANEAALKALNAGASGIVFNIHRKIDTIKLIKDISLDHIYSQFNLNFDSLHVLKDLNVHYGKINVHDNKIKCFVNIDPISLFERNGNWNKNKEQDLKIIEDLQHIAVDATVYQEAGANMVHELAFTLAHINEYFTILNNSGSINKKSIHVSFSVGSDFYGEIAKLRAFRKLISLLQKQYNTNITLHIHSQNTSLNSSWKDAYNNMLRSTTEAMSSVIGGVNSLHILPFDVTFNETSDFSSRIAINQQHILKDESYLNKVADISAGSYYIEFLTETLAEQSWETFKSIESKGGLLECLNTGFIQNEINNDFEALVIDYKEGKTTLLGVNKYINSAEKPVIPIPEKNKANNNGIKVISPKRLCDHITAS